MKRNRRLDIIEEDRAQTAAEHSERPHAASPATVDPSLNRRNDGPYQTHTPHVVGARPNEDTVSLNQRRANWGNLLWSDFTAQQPHSLVGSLTSVIAPGPRSERRATDTAFAAEPPLLPWPRGPLSDFVITTFGSRSGSVGLSPPITLDDPLDDDDFQLALYLCYELHYRDVANADLEWDPVLLSFRAELERVFVYRLRQFECPSSRGSGSLAASLDAMVEDVKVLDIGEYLELHATLDQLRAYCVHRSVSFLKCGDANSFGIARLKGGAKAAMAKIQFAEMGYGDASSMNSSHFAATMMALDLDPRHGAYVGHLPAASLAQMNLESLFGLHRRWRGALVGAVAVNKLSSVDLMDHCLHAMFRLDGSIAGANYFTNRMNSDAIHAFIARDQLVAGLVATDPEMSNDVLFGATAQLRLEENFERHALDAWSRGHSSLLPWGTHANGDVPHTVLTRRATTPSYES
jgi:hypothetical protein